MKIFTLSSAAPVVAILLSVPTIDSSSETVIRSPSIDVSFVNTDPTDTNGSVLSKKKIIKMDQNYVIRYEPFAESSAS